jgi:hypothetical protein
MGGFRTPRAAYQTRRRTLRPPQAATGAVGKVLPPCARSSDAAAKSRGGAQPQKRQPQERTSPRQSAPSARRSSAAVCHGGEPRCPGGGFVAPYSPPYIPKLMDYVAPIPPSHARWRRNTAHFQAACSASPAMGPPPLASLGSAFAAPWPLRSVSGRSGLSQTEPTGLQLRVLPDHLSGRAARARS